MQLFYQTLRFLVRIVLQIYFKKVILQGEDYIKKDKPLLIAANHPNSFLEACVLACWLKIPLHFIVRGDVFHPAFRWFFTWTNQIPIYRFRDGFSKMRNNVDTFAHCYEKLNEGAKIVIFSEGSTKWTKQLRPIQRGTGRIAEGALKANPQLDLQILPIGVNYEDVFKFRSTVEIKIGEPINVPSLADQEDLVNSITEMIRQRLSRCVVHLEEENNIPLFNIIAEVKNLYLLKGKSKLSQQFRLAEKFNNEHIDEEHLQAARNVLKLKDDLSLFDINKRHRAKPLYFPLYLWYPIHFALSILWMGPGLLAKFTARKVYADPAFEIPIRLGFAFLYYLAYIVLIAIFCMICLSTIESIIVMIFLLALAIIYPYSYDSVLRWKDQVIWRNGKHFPKRNTYIDRIKEMKV
jgi:1-acyl-sn-glycerol-3-phosphate acyltransferase